MTSLVYPSFMKPMDREVPAHIRRLITLSYQLSSLWIIYGLLGLCLHWEAGWVSHVRFIALCLCGVLIFGLIIYGCSYWARLLTAILPSFLIFILPIILSDIKEGYFIWFSFGLAAMSTIPQMVLSRKTEKVELISLAVLYLIALLFLDTWMLQVGGVTSPIATDEDYYKYYKVPQLFIWGFLNGMILLRILHNRKLEKAYIYMNEVWRNQLDLIEKQSADLKEKEEYAQKQRIEITEQRDLITTQKNDVENRSQRITFFNTSLLNLTKNKYIQSGEWIQALCIITKTASEVTGVSRVSIWEYDQKLMAIRNLNIFETQTNTHSTGDMIYAKDFPNYFKAIDLGEIIVANDAFTHSATADFSTTYLTPLSIKSMMDVPFFLEGNIFGVICFEYQHTYKTWSPEEISFAKSLADIITIAFKAYLLKQDSENIAKQKQAIEVQNHLLRAKQAETTQINYSLEQRIKERTSVLESQNHRLKEYAFINAHLLRGPLCRIMGLVNLIQMEEMKNDFNELIQKLHISSIELDEIVQHINQSLEEGKELTSEELREIRIKARQIK